MLVAVLSGFLAAIFAPLIHRSSQRYGKYVLSMVPLGILIYLATHIHNVSQGEEVVTRYQWFPELGIHVGFMIDGLSLVFALLVSGIGTVVIIYGAGYLGKHPKQERFFSQILFFMASMLGMVTADNLITIFIFWELTSISSYFLIGFDHEKEKSRSAALQALLVTGGGGLAMLVGFLFIGLAGGSFTFNELLTQGSSIRQHHFYHVILVLVFIGAFSKSAQFPFHFWLPNAMLAPTPVSAYLHSATMVKAGIYILARLNPVLGDTPAWQYTLLTVGGLTMILGAFQALGQTDLKRILAYTTISALGILVLLIGVGTYMAMVAAITFLVVHALYKGSLFLVAGTTEHETGTRDIRLLSGIARNMPWLATAGIMAAISYSGIPPFLGFIGKELIYESALQFDLLPEIITGVLVTTNMLLVATAIMTGIRPFIGKAGDISAKPQRFYATLLLPPLILAACGLLLGVLSNTFLDYIAIPGANAFVGITHKEHLDAGHGTLKTILLSIATIAGGVGFYFARSIGTRFVCFIDKHQNIKAETAYYNLMDNLLRFATWQTRFFQNGYLRHYILWIILTFLFLGTLTLFSFVDLGNLKLPYFSLFTYELLIVVVVMLAAVFAIRSNSILGAVASLGIVGYGIALFFVFYGAPDLALTQFSIETLTVILLVLVVYKIPRFASYSSKNSKRRDAIIAVSTGSFITLLLLVMLSMEPSDTISGYFLENTYLLAYGRNVVNVILVDFRAFDTLGEITVLGVAAMGVVTLLKLSLGTQQHKPGNPKPTSPHPFTPPEGRKNDH